ncbi:kinetochore-associated Ndc80 complex subunit nuf2 [Rhizophlyctis rosea]|nr:kinetochore-associated Ndc80 complex subunit nuf2 [Rhizophlyctis rosea]
MDPYSRNQQPKQQLTFPLLNKTELLTCMADLQIPFSEEDYQKPTMLRVLQTYEAFADILMGVTREIILQQQPNFAVMQILEYPDLHNDSIALMSFYRQLKKLINEVGVEDFSMIDILRPEGPRLRRILSAIINFVKFREERMQVFEMLTQKSVSIWGLSIAYPTQTPQYSYARLQDELQEKRGELENRNQDLSERVNRLRLERAEQEPALQALRDANSALTAELRELNRKQTTLLSESEALKNEKNELAGKLVRTYKLGFRILRPDEEPQLELTNNTIPKQSKTQMSITTLKQECTRLKSRIVQSPEKLKQAIGDMRTTEANEKATIMATEKRIRELEATFNLFNVVEQDITACLKLMEECEAERQKAEEAMSKVGAEKENIEKRKQELRDLEIREQQLQRQLNSAAEKLNRLERHQNVKTEGNLARLAKLKAEYERACAEREEATRKAEENERGAVALEQQMAEMRRQEAIDAAALADVVGKLTAKVGSYQSAIEKAMVAA